MPRIRACGLVLELVAQKACVAAFLRFRSYVERCKLPAQLLRARVFYEASLREEHSGRVERPASSQRKRLYPPPPGSEWQCQSVLVAPPNNSQDACIRFSRYTSRRHVHGVPKKMLSAVSAYRRGPRVDLCYTVPSLCHLQERTSCRDGFLSKELPP